MNHEERLKEIEDEIPKLFISAYVQLQMYYLVARMRTLTKILKAIKHEKINTSDYPDPYGVHIKCASYCQGCMAQEILEG